jgi:hypothetical protein
VIDLQLVAPGPKLYKSYLNNIFSDFFVTGFAKSKTKKRVGISLIDFPESHLIMM